jgi:hypothetical protein
MRNKCGTFIGFFSYLAMNAFLYASYLSMINFDVFTDIFEKELHEIDIGLLIITLMLAL